MTHRFRLLIALLSVTGWAFVVPAQGTTTQTSAPAATAAVPVTPPGPPVQVPAPKSESGYTTLFNRRDLTDWKIGGPAESFKVIDGAMVANGVAGAGHLFYDGALRNHAFRNFDLKLDVMAKNKSNGGVYILTQFQPTGFPTNGFEVQLNNSHTDRARTGSLYHVVDLSNVPAKDDEWFPMEVMVKDMTITVSLKGEQVLSWKQPTDWTTNYDTANRKIAPGTIAFQAHDPNSFTYYTNVRIKLLD